MRVGIDGLHLFGKYAGVKHSLANLVTGLRQVAPQDELVMYVPRDFKGPPNAEGDPGLKIRRTWFPGRWRLIRTLWRNFRLQSRSYAERCDLIHGATYALPSLLSKPSVVTIHDMIALTHPLFCTPGSSRVQRRIIPRSVQLARRVIVPSVATKDELLRNVRCAQADRIDVIPWGVGPEFHPMADQAERQRLRQTLRLPAQYVLYVGNLEPKKNLPLLIQSFFAARTHKRFPHKLVIAGQPGWKLKHLDRLIIELNAQDYVLFMGYVPQEVLPSLYALADLFVLPSLVEGFGLPVLEAMACGCPVIISRDPALREVAAEAARMVEYDERKPFQPLRESIEELLSGTAERQELIQRGFKRAAAFTWEQTARLTHQTYERALAE